MVRSNVVVNYRHNFAIVLTGFRVLFLIELFASITAILYKYLILNAAHVVPDTTKKSPTRSDFPPHLLATINSPNLRPRAANYATRPLPPISTSSVSNAAGSSSVPSSPSVRKSSSSVLGRFKAKVRDVAKPDVIVDCKPETPLDNGAYTRLIPVSANSLPSSPGSSKRQTPTEAPPIGVRPHRALPRMTSSAKTQTGSSLPRNVDTEPRLGNSTSGCTVADSPQTRVARPITLTLTAAAATSFQRRRLPSPPSNHVDAGVDKQQPSSRSVGTVTSPHLAAASLHHMTSGRCPGKYYSLQLKKQYGGHADEVRVVCSVNILHTAPVFERMPV